MGRKRFVYLTAIGAISSFHCLAQEFVPSTDDTSEPGAMSRASYAATSAFRQTRDGLANAAMSPLEDLNLRREEIPPVLAMLDNPYDLPHAIGCYEISAMIRDLDAALGPDWDAPRADKKKWDARAADGVAGAALGAVSSEASGMIPFRGVVRQLSQAEKHERMRRRAFKIGGQRRAFLKGVGHAKGCIGSAAPRWLEPQDIMADMYRQIQPSEQKEKELAEAAERAERNALSESEAETPSVTSEP